MADNETENVTESGLAAIGQRLARARESAGKERPEIASELHLRVEIIQALEEGNEAALPAAAFIRGYVRSYARCVGLDDAALVAHLPQPVEHRPVPRQRARKHYRAPSIPLGRVLVWGLVLLVLALVILYGAPAIERLWSGQQGQPVDNTLPLPQSGFESLPPAAEEATAPGETVAEQAAPAVSAPPEKTAAPAPVSRPVEKQPRASSDSKGGPAELTLRFSQDSWVEMTSRDRKLVVGTQHAGSERTVRAEPPIDILLGNAPGVTMYWRGKRFDITPYQRGKVARIKLEH